MSKKKTRPAQQTVAIAASGADLGNIVRKIREEAGLSQSQLAKRAGVALGTIVKIETGGTTRFDAIVRVAYALGQSPEEWLRLAGRDVTASRIEDILKQQTIERGPLVFKRLAPNVYFDRVIARLNERKTALMCAVVTSKIPFERNDLREQTQRLLSAGLHIAFLCPFPINVDDERSRGISGLIGYYHKVYGWACAHARRIGEWFPNLKRQVHIFRPMLPTTGMVLIPPPLLITRLRPCITKFSSLRKTDPLYEVGVYVQFSDNRPDQWIDIWSGEGEMAESAEEVYAAWRDYCSSILEAWDPGGDPTFNKDKLGTWHWVSGEDME